MLEIRSLEHIGDCSSFRLHRFPLDKAPPYIALSYFWGDPRPQHAISINSKQLSITSNLKAALSAVFSPKYQGGVGSLWGEGDRVFLWVDAICIYQKNVQEKNIEVPLMSEIYRRSKEGIGYIGAPSPGRDPSHPLKAFARRAGITRIVDSSDTLEDIDNNAIEFLSSPVFRRAWITQEAVLSPEFVCLYGNDADRATFALDFVGSLIQRIQIPGRGNPEHGMQLRDMEIVGPAILQIYVRVQLRNSLISSPDGINKVKVLSLTRPAEATDQRDKVYSLIGLLKQEDRQNIHVDYSESNTVAEVYTAIARYLVSTSDCMRMLAHAGKSRNYAQLPTWVPDWSSEPRYPLDYRHYRGCGDTSPSVRLSDDGQKLHLKALTFGKIKVMSPKITYQTDILEDGPFESIVADTHLVLLALEEAMFQFWRFCQVEFGRFPGHGTLRWTYRWSG